MYVCIFENKLCMLTTIAYIQAYDMSETDIYDGIAYTN